MTKQYIVDAFTDRIFCGNPAAVCVMKAWPNKKWMMNVAAENNLSETAYIVRENDAYGIRWFTPTTEVSLCGHATLASAFVVMNFKDRGCCEVVFHSKSGSIRVERDGDVYWMSFPEWEQHEIPVSDEMEKAFGARPQKAFLGCDLMCVFGSEDTVLNMSPDVSMLLELPGRLQNVTAPGRTSDCVSRSFGPKLGIYEDPVCGSAHCQIGPYWAGELGKDAVEAIQGSKRGGRLSCLVSGDGTIRIGGQAVLFAVSDIMA